MIIGHFTYDSTADSFTGDIACLCFRLSNVALTPKRGPSLHQPDYTITFASGSGTADVGSAWKRVSERGTPYLSVSLDSPSLETPINAALFMDAEGSGAVLVWTRQRSRAIPALVA